MEKKIITSARDMKPTMRRHRVPAGLRLARYYVIDMPQTIALAAKKLKKERNHEKKNNLTNHKNPANFEFNGGPFA